MKKLFTASLVAMMAVSAANAEIASTKYVTDRTGDTTFTGSVSTAADLTAAVNALAGKVDTVAGSGTGSVSDQIADALENYDTSTEVDGKISNATKDMATDGELTAGLALKEDTANKKDAYVKGWTDQEKSTFFPTVALAEAIVNEAKQSTADAISDLNDTVAANKSAADTGIQQAKDAAATAESNAKAYTDQLKNGQVKTNTDAIAALDSTYAKDSELTTAVSTLEGKIQQAQQAATYNDTEVRGLIGDNADEIAAIKASDYATSGVTATTVAQVTTNKNDIAGIKTEQTTQNNAISALQTSLGATGDTGKAIAAAQAAANAAQGEVDALEGVVAQNKADAATAAANAKSDAIADAAGKYQVKSSAMSIGAAGGEWTDLTKAANYATTGTFSLVLKDGTIAWEKVSY